MEIQDLHVKKYVVVFSGFRKHTSLSWMQRVAHL